MKMRDDVQDFISRRWSGDTPRWTDGNCYWFAFILCERFPLLEMYYCPVSGHFLAGDGIDFFDFTGLVSIDQESEDAPLKLSTIYRADPLWYTHIIRDCKM